MKGYRTLAWGLFLAIVPGALSYLAGVHWADYVSPELAFIITGGVTIVLRGITDTPLGSDLPKKLFAVAAGPALGLALLFGTGEVRAADMPVKAPTAAGAKSCAPYLGLNAMGAGSAINANTGSTGASPFGAVSLQGDVGVTLGEFCQLAKSGNLPKWIFGEIMVDYSNLNGGAAGFSMTGPVHIEERIGVSFGALGDYLPSFFNVSVPSITNLLPPGSISGSPQLYGFAAGHQQDISINFGDAQGRDWALYGGLGFGTLTVVTASDGSKVTWDSFIEGTLAQSAVCVGGRGCGSLSPGVRVGLQVKN